MDRWKTLCLIRPITGGGMINKNKEKRSSTLKRCKILKHQNGAKDVVNQLVTSLYMNHRIPHDSENRQQTFNSSNSSAVVYGLGHQRSRSRGKCIVSSVSRDIASLLFISPEIGYLSCRTLNQPTFHRHRYY